MNVKRSEFVLGALSAELLGCTKVDAVGDTENTKEKIGMKKPLPEAVRAEGDLRDAEEPDACGRVGHPHVGAGTVRKV